MACTNCFNNCSEIISDKCIRYTGIDIPSLGITNGDSLLDINQVLTENIVNIILGDGVTPDIDINSICETITKHLPGCGTFTLNNFINAFIQSICDLQTQISNNTNELVILNANYVIGCLTGVTASSKTHDILQATISQLCSVVSGQNALSNLLNKFYSKNGTQLDNYISNYLNTHNTVSTKQSTKMIPYVAYEFYGSLTGKFDSTGVGLSNSDWEKIYICNGQNGTPDKRGRVAVGATDSPGPAISDPIINPAISGNPTWSAATLGGWTMFGSNNIVLIPSQIPNHTHSASATSTQSEHSHYTYNTDTSGNPVITNVTYPQVANNDGTSYQYNIKGSNTVPSIGKTNSITPAISTNVTIASTAGGGGGHPNTQPGIAAYYIMYIP